MSDKLVRAFNKCQHCGTEFQMFGFVSEHAYETFSIDGGHFECPSCKTPVPLAPKTRYKIVRDDGTIYKDFGPAP